LNRVEGKTHFTHFLVRATLPRAGRYGARQGRQPDAARRAVCLVSNSLFGERSLEATVVIG